MTHKEKNSNTLKIFRISYHAVYRGGILQRRIFAFFWSIRYDENTIILSYDTHILLISRIFPDRTHHRYHDHRCARRSTLSDANGVFWAVSWYWSNRINWFHFSSDGSLFQGQGALSKGIRFWLYHRDGASREIYNSHTKRSAQYSW